MRARSRTARPPLSRLGAICVALALVLSLVLVTASRRAAMAAFSKTEVEYAQFVAIGGSLKDLCQDGKIPHPGSSACDACRLTDLAVLPIVATVPVSFQTASPPQAAAIEARRPDAVFVNPATPVRGPPMLA